MEAILLSKDGTIEKYDICASCFEEIVDMHKYNNFVKVILSLGEVDVTFTRKIYENKYNTDIFNSIDFIIENYKIPVNFNTSKASDMGIVVNKKIKIENYNIDVISFDEVTSDENYMIIDNDEDNINIGQQIRVIVEDDENRMKHNCVVRSIVHLKSGFIGVLLTSFGYEIKTVKQEESEKKKEIKVHFYKQYASKTSNEVISKVDRIFYINDLNNLTENIILFNVKDLSKDDYDEISNVNNTQRVYIEVKDNLCRKTYDGKVTSVTSTEIYTEYKFMILVEESNIQFYSCDKNTFKKPKYNKDNKKLYDAYVNLPCVKPYATIISAKITDESLSLAKIIDICSKINMREVIIEGDNKIITLNLEELRELHHINDTDKFYKHVQYKNGATNIIEISKCNLFDDVDKLDVSDKDIVSVDYIKIIDGKFEMCALNQTLMYVIRKSNISEK